MVVRYWLSPAPTAAPRTNREGLRAEEDAVEIERLCDDLAAAEFIEPVTRR